MTRPHVLDYLAISHDAPLEWLSTPRDVFGGRTGDDYGREFGWAYVMAAARKVFQ